VARKLAVAYYRLVKEGVLYEDPGAEAYEDPGAEAYEERFREQKTRWLKKQAGRLGMTLVEANP
jgi:hypothetical protein